MVDSWPNPPILIKTKIYSQPIASIHVVAEPLNQKIPN